MPMIGNGNDGNPGHPTQDAPASQTGVLRIFVSYSRKDSLFTRRLYDALAARGIDAWVDWEGIPPSAEWWREVERAIEAAEAFVFVITPESMGSAVCQNEIAHALRHNKRLIPLVFRDPAQPAQPATDLTAAIGRINWIYFRETDDFEQGLARLIEAIKTDLDWVRAHSRLLQRAIEWHAHDRDESFLLQKNDLMAAEAWLREGPVKEPGPTTLQTEYVLTSRTSSVRRRRRLLGGAAVAMGLILVASLVAGWQKLISDVRESEAMSRRLAAQVPQAFDSDAWDLGLLLGVEAYDTAATVEATNALQGGLERLRGVRAILPGRFDGDGPVSFSGDGKWLAAVACAPSSEPGECSGSELAILDAVRGAVLATLPAALKVIDIAFDSAGKRLAVSTCCFAAQAPGVPVGPAESEDEASNRWTRIHVVEIPAAMGAASSPVRMGKPMREIVVAGGAVRNLVFKGRGELVGVSRDILTWRLDDAAPGRKIPLLAEALGPGAAKALVLQSTGPWDPPTAVLWGLAEPPRQLASVTGFAAAMGHSVAFNADQSLAAVLSCAMMASGRHCNGELRLADFVGKRMRGTAVKDDVALDSMLAVVFSRNGKWIATGGCGQSSRSEACVHGQLRLWQVEQDGLTPLGPPIRAYGGTVRRLAVSQDGRTLASLSSHGKITLWSIDSDYLQTTGVLPSVLQTRFKPPATSSSKSLRCGKDEVKDPQLLQLANTLRQRTDLCRIFSENEGAFAWDEGRRLLAVADCVKSDGAGHCSNATMTVWSSMDGQLRKEREHAIGGGWVTDIAIAPGPGDRIAIGRCQVNEFKGCTDAGSIELLGASGVQTRTLLRGIPRVSALAWDPRGDLLAYATCVEFPESGAPIDNCAAGAINLTEVSTGRILDGTLSAHHSAVSVLRFNGAGTLLASGDDDGNVAFWDPASRQALGPLLPIHYASIRSLQFVSATNLVAVSGEVSLELSASADGWKSIACRLAGRVLTEAERRRWVGARDAAQSDPCNSDGATRRSGWWQRLRLIVARG